MTYNGTRHFGCQALLNKSSIGVGKIYFTDLNKVETYGINCFNFINNRNMKNKITAWHGKPENEAVFQLDFI